MASNNDSAQFTKVPRFTEKDNCNAFYMDVPPGGFNLAVYGYNQTTAKTFIDLFALRNCLDSKDTSLSMTSQPYFSKEFTKRSCPSWSRRCVCLLDDTVLVTFCCDKIESYDTENGPLVNQRKFGGEVTCMTAKDGMVYVGPMGSHDVIVFDWGLNQINTIRLKELKRSDYPRELTVNNKKLFICTSHGRALRYNIKGDVEHTWEPIQQYNVAMSITVSEVNGLIFILWNGGSDKRIVVVYSLHEDYSSVISVHSLALFKVAGNSSRIRINNNVNRLFLLTRIGKVYEYHTDNIVSFENLLTLIELLLDKYECQKLLKYFGVPVAKGKITKTGELSNLLFQHLRETGKLTTGDINPLLRACFDQAITKVQWAWANYQQFLSSQLLRRSLSQSQFQKQSDKCSEPIYKLKEIPLGGGELAEKVSDSSGELKIALEKMAQFKKILESQQEEIEQLEVRLTTTDDEKLQLSDRLSTTEKELGETRLSLRAARDELVKTQMNYAKESMALQEVLRQTRETLSKQAMISTASLEVEQTVSEGRETSAISVDQESTALAADYGRLMVDVAEDLTLDNVLKLAYLLRLPNSESDMLRRISLIETPGITLMNFIKKRNIINMYDVNNLQRALMQLHLHSTNKNHVVPYQQKVDPFQFEENRSPYLVDWPDEEAEASKTHEWNVPHEDRRTGESKEPQDDHAKGRLTEKIEIEETPTSRQHIMHPYIEHRIDYEGGTITLMGICLSIPQDALAADHVIAVTVLRDPDVHLPGSAKRSRITPLIKLEPEDIKFNKTARLTIPHSAIIPEPDCHSVVVFTGQQGGLQKGEITWRKETSLNWKLEQENISLDINTMGYIFVNLVNHEMKQKHVFRVIPFTDGILGVENDLVITVCFCKDKDDAYKLLLEEFKSKLILGDYTTFQVSRALNDCRDANPCLDLVMSPQGGSYHLNKEEARQVVDIDHLCAASRVSHQFRFKRTRTGNIDMIDVKLKLSQGEKNQIALTLQSHVKNLLLSPDSQGLLHGEMTRDSQQYEHLKTTVSGLLSKDHCEKLAVFFDLTPAERDTVLNDVRPGMVLMKILDERELIMPNKMIGLYEGLKASHLNKIARKILNYIDASQRKDVMKSDAAEDEQTKFLRKSQNEEEKNPQEGQFLQLTRNVKRLMEEGFNRIDVQRALKLSHGKVELGRRLLLLAKDEHERLPLFPGSTLYKEQYIDENGGEMNISGVHLLVPAGALHVGRIVSLMVSTYPAINGPISNKSLRLTPFVKLGPDGIELHKPVIMCIPHCALIAGGQTYIYYTHMYSGILQKDKTIKWNLESEQFNCSMNSNQLEVKIQKHCLIGPHIPYQAKMRKRIGVVPIINRPSSLDDQSTISLWFYNDEKLEHESLINEEVYNNNGIEINRPVSIQLESMNSTFYVNISSSTQQCSAFPRRVDVAMNALWLQNRHKVVFQLQNIGRQDILNLEIEGKAGLLKNLFRFSLQLKLKDLQNSIQITSPFQYIVPKFIVESLQQLNLKLSEHLNAEESTQLANIFQLDEDVITSIQIQRKPGHLLLKALTNKSLVTPANISSLESALTEQGNEECAKLVREFRKNNPLVKATMCQEEKF